MSGRVNVKVQYCQHWEQWLDSNLFVTLPRPKAPIEIVERELWRTTDWPLGRGVAGEVAEQHLLHRAKETLNAPAAPWLSGERMEQAHVEIDTDLVKMG